MSFRCDAEGLGRTWTVCSTRQAPLDRPGCLLTTLVVKGRPTLMFSRPLGLGFVAGDEIGTGDSDYRFDVQLHVANSGAPPD